MEEKKQESKSVQMKPLKTAPSGEHPQKLSYESLNQMCMDMSQRLQGQNKYIDQLRQQLQRMDYALQGKRMDYLFKVLEHQGNFKSDFIITCCSEIEEALTIPEGEEESKEG